ncbi:hypothetical protein CYMTET_49858 [Cymbomonas tetramitiformis]|uniref:AIM24 family protein n=1 Tax=Cymbomonas tetramitiformis TaxID=36881 RepID=A0AAE0BQJ9_9CHLO|nr:hypothetical protein CYMTET_49858 [Cymbomonas tetramitiformis]
MSTDARQPRVTIHGEIATVILQEGERLRSQYDSTIGRNTAISAALVGEGKGLLAKLSTSVAVKALGDENAIGQWFEGPGEVLLSCPGLPEQIAEINLDSSEEIIFKKGSWLASTSGISITPTFESVGSAVWNAIRGNLGNSLLLRARAEKAGRLLLSSVGNIHHKTLSDGETYKVDNGNLLAWTSSAESAILPCGGNEAWYM